jgi:hypothetical protein
MLWEHEVVGSNPTAPTIHQPIARPGVESWPPTCQISAPQAFGPLDARP